MNYEYKMVQISKDLGAKVGNAENIAARYLQGVVDTHAVDGWEYYRTDNLTVTERPGCLAGLFGQKEVFYSVGVVCFRRQK